MEDAEGGEEERENIVELEDWNIQDTHHLLARVAYVISDYSSRIDL
jgi:hypothetical protein